MDNSKKAAISKAAKISINTLLDKYYLSLISEESKARFSEVRSSFDNLFKTLEENKIDVEDLYKINAFMETQNEQVNNLIIREIASILFHLIDIYLSLK